MPKRVSNFYAKQIRHLRTNPNNRFGTSCPPHWKGEYYCETMWGGNKVSNAPFDTLELLFVVFWLMFFVVLCPCVFLLFVVVDVVLFVDCP